MPMGSSRTRLIDRNRYSKRYPIIRAPQRLTYLGDSDVAMEIGSIYFDNSAVGTFTYEVQFSDADYQVSAALRNTNVESSVNVHLYVSSKTQTSVTVEASAAFTGYVDVFAVKIVS